MSAEIYYLSGTGNSLHVAKEVQKRLPDARLIPLAALRDRERINTAGDIVGFIFPIHFMTAPSVIFHIIEKMDISSANYIFIVATRYGTPCSIMYKRFDSMLKKKGKRLDSYVTITMANNDPKFKLWEPAMQEALDAFEIALQKKVDLLCEHILKQEGYQEQDCEVTFKVNPAMERLGVMAITLFGDGKEIFYSDSNCEGCGTCEKVCLSSKIKMADGKPQWIKDKDCYSCYACLNYCPQHSIQIKSTPFMKFYTEENKRYHHVDVSADEIALQKHLEATI